MIRFVRNTFLLLMLVVSFFMVVPWIAIAIQQAGEIFIDYANWVRGVGV